MDTVACVKFKFYENQIVFEKRSILVKNAQNFFRYFHRFRFAVSLSLDFDPYSKKRL
jgi:hypothetical protein